MHVLFPVCIYIWLIIFISFPTDRLNRLVSSLFLFGDVEANDITFALLQGKSIQEVQSYITYITQAQINAARVRIRKPLLKDRKSVV